MKLKNLFLLFLILVPFALHCAQESKIFLGVDVFFQERKFEQWKGKRVGLITNQTGVDRKMRSTVDLFLDHASELPN